MGILGGEDRGSESICISYRRQMVTNEGLAGHYILLGKSESMSHFIRGIRRLVKSTFGGQYSRCGSGLQESDKYLHAPHSLGRPQS